jgi:polar amino acid transport system substrate-binding protein
MMGVSALALAASFVGGAAVAGTLENVKARGKLVVGVKNDYVPYG